MLTQILDAKILSLWNGTRELVYPYIISQNQMLKLSLWIRVGVWKKRWSKHENKHSKKYEMQNLNQWVGYLNGRITYA